jgi:glycosyltransferase involved in cell wall biosynthesis
LSSRWAGFFPRQLWPTLTFLNTLARLSWRFATQGRPRLMVSHGLSEQVLAYLLSRFFGTPFAAQVHEVYLPSDVRGLNKLFLWLEGIALRRAAFLIFPEKRRADLYRARYRLKQPIEIAANCPRLRQPLNPALTREDLRTKLQIPANGTTLLGYFGGLGQLNALPDTIRAVARIPKLHFQMWGWGDRDFVDTLKKLAEGVGARERIHFMGELPDDKWPALEGLDASLVVYDPEVLKFGQRCATASNKLMESMAAGVPVVTNGSDDFRAVVETLDVGLCLPEVTIDAMAQTLRTLFQDRLGLKRRADNGIRAHLGDYHYEAQFGPALARFRTHVPASLRETPTPALRAQKAP